MKSLKFSVSNIEKTTLKENEDLWIIKPSTTVEFLPQPDITTYELALLFSFIFRYAEKELSELPESCLRHLKITEEP